MFKFVKYMTVVGLIVAPTLGGQNVALAERDIEVAVKSLYSTLQVKRSQFTAFLMQLLSSSIISLHLKSCPQVLIRQGYDTLTSQLHYQAKTSKSSCLLVFLGQDLRNCYKHWRCYMCQRTRHRALTDISLPQLRHFGLGKSRRLGKGAPTHPNH